MDIRAALAAQAYSGAKPATTPATQAGAAQGAGGGAAGLARDFADTLKESEAIAKEAMVGRADPHSLVQALAETQLAVETAVTVRDRVVEAYQEILRMPV